MVKNIIGICDCGKLVQDNLPNNCIEEASGKKRYLCDECVDNNEFEEEEDGDYCV